MLTVIMLAAMVSLRQDVPWIPELHAGPVWRCRGFQSSVAASLFAILHSVLYLPGILPRLWTVWRCCSRFGFSANARGFRYCVLTRTKVGSELWMGSPR